MTKNVKYDPIKKFNESIDSHNKEIETYRKLAPAVMPIIKKYLSSITSVWLSLTMFSIGFKNGTPPQGFLLKCEQLGLDVEVSCGTFNFMTHPRDYNLTLRGKCQT